MWSKNNIISRILVVIILFLGIYYFEWTSRFFQRLHTAMSGEVKKKNERWVQTYLENSMDPVESWNNKESEKVLNKKSHKSIEHREFHNTTDNGVIWDTYKSMDVIVERQDFQNTTDKVVKNTYSQRSRKDSVKHLCNAHRDIIPNINSIKGLFYPEVPFYYCNVPKFGTTFLKAFFREALHYNGIRREEYVHTQHANEHMFSYLNVGDPYDRLFSAYKGKLYRPNGEFWKHTGKNIVETVRKNNTTQDAGYNVTFTELVQFVVNGHETGKVLNGHFEPIHKLCNACKTRFDFIGRKETMSEDLVNLFDILNTAGIVKNKVPVSTLENTVRSFQRVNDHSILDLFKAVKDFPHLSVYYLFLRYWAVYQISGVVLNQYELPFSESEVKSISHEQFKEVLMNAVERSKDYKEQLRLQRQEALVQAYRSVPLPLMLRLREFVKLDCLLFSYDDKPDLLFNRDTHNNITHVYMKGI